MPQPRPRLIGLPYDASSSFLRGAAQAPALIRAALHSTAGNLWTEGLRDLAGPDGLADAGDLSLPPTADARRLIEAGVSAVLAEGDRPIALGGDHSVTYPILRAIAQAHAPLTLLHIDAHPDLYDVFEGDRYSHACPFARIMEAGLATRLVQIGVRTSTARCTCRSTSTGSIRRTRRASPTASREACPCARSSASSRTWTAT